MQKNTKDETKDKTKDKNKFEFVEEGHKYFLNGKRLTGVTTIIGIIDKPQFIQWASNQAIDSVIKGATYQRKENIYTVTKDILEDSRKAWVRTRDKAGDVGTILHAIVEDYVKSRIAKRDFDFETSRNKAVSNYKIEITQSEIEKTKPMFDQFLEWEKEDNVTFLLSEQKMYSEKYWFAGTVDLVFIKNGDMSKIYIGDLKTSIDVYYSHFIQMGGYEIQLKEMGKIKNCAGYCVINIPKIIDKDGNAFRRVKYERKNSEDMETFKSCCFLYRYKSKHEKRFGTTRAKKTGINNNRITIKL